MKNFKNYVFAAMFAALVLMGTMFIQVPSINGYVHIGDAFVYLAACFIPAPFSVLAAGLGAAIADVVTGYVIYAPFTFIIKGCMAFCFSSKGSSVINKRNIAALLIADAVNIAGYYLTEVILLPQGSLTATLIQSLYTIPGNFVQSLTASVIFTVTALALDKLKFKNAIDKI